MFRLAKQLVSKNRDVVSASCVKVMMGRFVVEEDKLMEVWRAHYDNISNKEFTWDIIIIIIIYFENVPFSMLS